MTSGSICVSSVAVVSDVELVRRFWRVLKDFRSVVKLILDTLPTNIDTNWDVDDLSRVRVHSVCSLGGVRVVGEGEMRGVGVRWEKCVL
jgi:hypothetical protein